MKTSKRLPISWVVLAGCLGASVVVMARQEGPTPPLEPPIISGPEPFESSPIPFGEAPAAEASDATADSFLEENRRLAARRLAELTEECDRLREELAKAEAERTKWQAISEAMAAVPERFHQLTQPSEPILEPTGAAVPVPEPAFDGTLPPAGDLLPPARASRRGSSGRQATPLPTPGSPAPSSSRSPFGEPADPSDLPDLPTSNDPFGLPQGASPFSGTPEPPPVGAEEIPPLPGS